MCSAEKTLETAPFVLVFPLQVSRQYTITQISIKGGRPGDQIISLRDSLGEK